MAGQSHSERRHDERPSTVQLSESDLVVVAGDISNEITRIEQALGYLLRTGAQVLFVVRNHEAWLTTKQIQQATETAS